jgi:hypothetical protein
VYFCGCGNTKAQEKGEIVMVKEPVMASSDTKAAAKKLDHIRVAPAKNGGYTVEHHYKGGMGTYHQPDVYAFGKGPEVINHLNDHLGVKENRKIASSTSNNYKEKPGGKADSEMADNEPTVYQGNRRTPAERRGVN